MKVNMDEMSWLEQSMRLAMQALLANSSETPTPQDVIFRAIQEACETERKMPNQEAAWLYSQRSLWPEIRHDYKDLLEAYEALLARIKAGEESPDVLFPGARPSPGAIGRMDAIVSEIPKMLVGRDRRRDWQILHGLAWGREQAVVARRARCSPRQVRRQRDFQLDRLADQFVDLYPDVFYIPKEMKSAA